MNRHLKLNDCIATPALAHAIVGVGLWLIAIAGCSGSARVDILSLEPNAIDPPPANIFHYKARECFWWTENGRDVVIAMRCGHDELISPFGTSALKLSFVLDGPPEGGSRNYRVGRREVRGVFEWGLERHCFSSYQGICAVMRRGDGRLGGSFRLFLLHQPGPGLLDLFPRQPSNVLFLGDFEAVPERDGRGHRLRDQTEAHGWDRRGDASSTSAATRPS